MDERNEGNHNEPLKPYDEADEAEQIQRFQRLINLCRDEKFEDFLSNAYKYPEILVVAEAQGDQQKHAGIFSQAVQARNLVKQALEYYLSVKQQNLKKQKEDRAFLQDEIEKGSHFADWRNYQLNVERLAEAFSWSLASYVRGGKTIGRKPTVQYNDDEISQIKLDLIAILTQVNQFR
jgi:hypothetical protein